MTLRHTFGLAIPLLLVGAVLWTVLSGRSQEGALLHTVAVEGSGWPRTAVSVHGVRSTIGAPPERVVVATTTGVDYATALLPPERIAAICEQAFTWSVLARNPQPAYAKLPVFHELTTEIALSHDPDLVVVSAYNDPETISALTGAGVPVVCLRHPFDLAGVVENLHLLASALGTEQEAARLEEELRRRLQTLRDGHAGRDGLVGLYYSQAGGGGWTEGSDSLAGAALAAAGLENGAARLGMTRHAKVTLEQLIALNPDWIIVSARFGEAHATAEAYLRSEPAAQHLDAVRAGHFVRVHPSLFSTSSQEVVTLAEQIAATVDAAAKGGTQGRGR